MTRAQSMLLGLLVMLGLAAATYVAVGRVVVEQTNVAVGLAVDYSEAEELAASSGTSATAVLQSLHSAGATHLAVAEDTLQVLLGRGQAAAYSTGPTTEIWLDSAARLLQVAGALSAKLPGDYARTQREDGSHWLTAPSLATSALNVGVGYPPEALRAAKEAGLQVVARPHWQGVRTPTAVTASLNQAAQAGAGVVVFTGDQVVGHPGLIDVTARALEHNQMTFGMIELAPQNGADRLAGELRCRVVRVHSITEPEMQVMSPRRAVDRFVRAARERNVRLLYLRLFPGAEAGGLDTNLGYVGAVTDGLGAHGLRPGIPRPFAPFHTPLWLLALVRIGVCGASLWLIQALFGLRPAYFWPLALLVIIAGAGATFVATGLARSMAALVAAIVFPLLAVLYAARTTTVGELYRPALLYALGPLLAAFVKVCVISAFGGLLIVGALGDSSYLMKVAQFRGVKLAQLIPLLGVALVWLARSTAAYRAATADTAPSLVDFRTGVTRPEWPALWRGLRQAFRQVVVYWHVAAALAGLAVVGLLILRSGHETGAGVLPVELQFRALLDRLLVVRPRTKEVFLGHPIMILALLLALRGMRRGLWVGFALGAIGQISLVNSFCHTHTPLLVTLVRVFNGLWVGALAGLVLCILWDALGGRPPRRAEQPLMADDLYEEQG
jgi:hypothetical protein